MESKRSSSRTSYISLLAVMLLALFLLPSISATSVEKIAKNNTEVYPGEDNNVIFAFRIVDGGDTDLYNNTAPGSTLNSFEKNGTMFLNQSNDDPKGLNGYNAGEDIFNVSRVDTGRNNETISSSVIRGFSSPTLFADSALGSAVLNNQFDGGLENAGVREAILRDNGSIDGRLDNGDFVISAGELNMKNFGSDMYFTDVNSTTDFFDGAKEAIVRDNGSDPNILDSNDDIIRAANAGLTKFNDNNTVYSDSDGDESYSSGNAIVREKGNDDHIFEAKDNVIVNGSVNSIGASSTNLRYFNSTDTPTPSFDNVGEPIYYSNETRIGYVNVFSGNDTKAGNVELGLPSMHYVYETPAAPFYDNAIGKELYPVTDKYTNYGEDGRFWVYEYDTAGEAADGTWDPNESAGDQDALVYDVRDGSTISKGDVLIYDENASNSNISILPGAEFDSEAVTNSKGPDNSYQVDTADIGFVDNGSESFEFSQDNVSVNISYNSNWEVVSLAPTSAFPGLGYSGTFNTTRGDMRFWNASDNPENMKDNDSGDPYSDGLYVDMDFSGNITTGDVRIGVWSVEEPPGQIERDDLDENITNASLVEFRPSDDVMILDGVSDGVYTAGSGKVSDTNGREAIVSSSDLYLNSTDTLVRSGNADFHDFSDDVRYTDGNLNGSFEKGEAIGKDGGGKPNILQESDRILVGGWAALSNFTSYTKYIESSNNSRFEKGSNESIVYDTGDDDVLERGNLSFNTSDGFVIIPGKAHLTVFSNLPASEKDSGLVYVDKNNTGKFNGGEDILNITLLLNSSDSTSISGERIFNFANVTRHNGTAIYEKGDAIINDTDNNTVYEDVLKGLEIENIYNKAFTNANYDEKLESDQIESGNLELWIDSDSDGDFYNGDSNDTKIAEIKADSSIIWNNFVLSVEILETKSFYVTYDAKYYLPEKAYGMKAKGTKIELDSRLDSGFLNAHRQILDAHPPELDVSITGNEFGGDSTERRNILLKLKESFSGINSEDINSTDFDLSLDRYNVSNASYQGREILLTLNDTLETNATPKVWMNGSLKDDAGNKLDFGSTTTTDGLEPLITHVRYQDTDVNGTLDEIDVFFSENVSYTNFNGSNWEITDAGIEDFNVSNGTVSNDYMLELNASAVYGVTGVENRSLEPLLNFTTLGNAVSDGSGNTLSNVSNITMIDDAAPALVNATTSDVNHDSAVDRIWLNLSEDLDDNMTDFASAFNLSQGVVDSTWSNETNDSVVLLNVSSVGNTSVTPDVEMFSGTVFDESNNTAQLNQTFTRTFDSARPVLLSAEIDPFRSNSRYSFVQLHFGETVNGTWNATSRINVSNKSLTVNITSMNASQSVNFTMVLETENHPNVSAITNLTDEAGNPAVLEGMSNVTVNTYRRKMSEGWNFISFPIAGEDTPKISNTIDLEHVRVIWTKKNGSWLSYDPDAPTNDFDSFKGGRGYLLNASEKFILDPNVNNKWTTSGEEGVQRATAPLNPGNFTLVGQFQEYIQDADTGAAFNSVAPGGIGTVYRQKKEGTLKLEEMKAMNVTDTDEHMIPGNAYWAWSKNVTSWTWADPKS